MRLSVPFAMAGLGMALPVATQAKVISFHNANQGYSHYGGYNVLMYGQGKASDPGNNLWNGFGQYKGPGSTAFFGANNPDSGHGAVPNGSPGQPYAWFNGTSASGTALFSPTNSAAPNTGNVYSDGTISPITFTSTYTGDNGADGGITQGSPSWVLSHASLVSGSTLGTFALQHVPAGTYNLFLYGANFDGTRGAAFTASSGTAAGGITSTINPNASPTDSALNSYVLGQTYVEFVNVTPDAGGTISGTWGAVSNPISGLSGEGDFNGLQLQSVPVPEPVSISAAGLAVIGMLRRRRRRE